jgi:hypothetical protein
MKPKFKQGDKVYYQGPWDKFPRECIVITWTEYWGANRYLLKGKKAPSHWIAEHELSLVEKNNITQNERFDSLIIE